MTEKTVQKDSIQRINRKQDKGRKKGSNDMKRVRERKWTVEDMAEENESDFVSLYNTEYQK